MNRSIRRQSFVQPEFRGDLQPHQAEGVHWLLQRPRALLADDVGLGKTVQALALIGTLFETDQLPHAGRNRLCRVLWLTDATLVEQTMAEVETFLPNFTVLGSTDPAMASGGRAQQLRKRSFPSGVDILVMSYEQAHSRRQWLEQFSPSMLVLDEASKLKGEQSFFRTVEDISRRTPRVLSMTATPLENNPTELFAILRATGTPGLWPKRVIDADFIEWELSPPDHQGKRRKIPVDWVENKVSEVRDYLSGVMFRRTAEDIDLDLPRHVGDRIRWVPLGADQQAEYDAAARQTGLSGFHKQQAAGLRAGTSSVLIDALMEELLRSGEPTIVYCESLEMLALAAERFSAAGIEYRQIEGKTTSEDRSDAVQEFRDGGVYVLLGSSVLEHGLNLQTCRKLISLDSSWNPQRENQREGRIRRIGSPHATYEHITLLPDTPLTRKKVGRLEKKSRMARAVCLG